MARILMARFDVYRNPGRTAAHFPYLLDIQSNHISGLATRIVVPLRAVAAFAPVPIPGDLCPVIHIEGRDCFLDTPQLGAIPARELTEFVTTVREHQSAITAALDKVFGGY